MSKWISLLIIILIFVLIKLCENKYKKDIDHKIEAKKIMKDSLLICIAFVAADFLKNQFIPSDVKVPVTTAFTGDPKF